MLNRTTQLISRMKIFKLQNCLFSTASDLSIPVIDLNKFNNRSQGWEGECKTASECLHETGIIVVKDDRVVEKDNKRFIKMMEDYFNKVSKGYYAGKSLEDAHPENFYQNGVTPEYKEKARPHCERFKNYLDEDKPISECPPVYDAKWRFFWRIGEIDEKLEEESIVFPNVIPEGFPRWEQVMDNWGNKMLAITETSAKVIAHGFKLPEKTFTDMMKYGGHLLAPTGSDLAKFDVNTAFAGVHYDLNFLTIHGKSNYGGLYIWLRNGQKKRVRIPDGCLLIQAGIQLQYLTGGECMAGFHEVIYPADIHEQVAKIQEENKEKNEEDKKILWRISSTLFAQIRQDVMLQPLAHFRTPEALSKYPPILTKTQVAEELKAISLM